MRGPRAQTDRKLYREAMQAAIRAIANLSVIEGEAADILLKDGRAKGIRTAEGEKIRCGASCSRPELFARRHPYRHKSFPAGRMGKARRSASARDCRN